MVIASWQMNKTWKFHAGSLLVAGAGVLTVGWALGHPGTAILAALAAYSMWHFVNIWRLYFWIQNPGREKPASLGVWADIFDRISSMEQRNRKQKARYQSMIDDFQNLTDAFPDATLIIDANARLTWFNNSAGTLLELKEPEDIGRPVTNLVRSADFNEWLAIQDEVKSRLEMPAPGKENTWLDVSTVSIRGDQRLIILRDFSEVHYVEQIRKDFVTNISHELRTPLTVMRGYLELLQDRPSDELTDAINRMHTQAIQMQTMLDDLLDLSRLQAVEAHGEEEYVDIAAILLQLREQADEISRGNHVLQFDVESGLALHGIKSDLESAFRNLIVNALKYTPDGGSVSVSWYNSDQGATLSVTDTGIGIPKREIPRLTERFYRVGSDRGRESGGTGLGLAIVKHVLNRHQARLVIDSEYGVGSQFTCVFPPERHRTVTKRQ
jgi:two-component system phosphate regulon sensor histidine kinase PhoR